MDLDEALELVVTAAREHLAAVRAAGGTPDDARVWHSYVTLNNACHAYDQLLLDVHGEVTPWETEPIDLRSVDEDAPLPYLTEATPTPLTDRQDPHQAVVSVRQRRDYRVPSVSALLAVAGNLANEVSENLSPEAAVDSQMSPPATVAGAVLQLLRLGDGTVASLDLSELEPMAGAVTLVETAQPLPPGTTDAARLFQLATGDQVVGRLDDPPPVAPPPPTAHS